jgi:death-on-curing protein
VKRPVWLLRDTILVLHEQLIATFGGPAGIRDEGLLDSALARPENRLAYGKPTIFDLAAAYAFGLVKNHAFIDGNKRIGFAAAVVFLETNGYIFEAAEADAVLRTLALAASAMTESDYAHWMKANSRRAKL